MKSKEIDFSIFDEVFAEICDNDKYRSLKSYTAHGNVSVYDHSIEVAKRSYTFAVKRRIKCDLRALVVGALLHDYFLYDWHDQPKFTFHGFKHAKISAINADRDYEISKKEKNIIESHMFPLNLLHIPRSKEAWIVTWQDKCCALKETLKRKKDNER